MKLKIVAGKIICILFINISYFGPTPVCGQTILESSISIEQLLKMPKAVKIINSIVGEKLRVGYGTGVYYSLKYDIFVNTNDILRMDNGPYHSLTFSIFRLPDSGFTENLVLSDQGGGVCTSLNTVDRF